METLVQGFQCLEDKALAMSLPAFLTWIVLDRPLDLDLNNFLDHLLVGNLDSAEPTCDLYLLALEHDLDLLIPAEPAHGPGSFPVHGSGS